MTFGRGSAPYLATLPTIFSEEEESGILNMNNNRTGAVNRNQLDSTSSDTMALSAEEVEEVVRLVLVSCQTEFYTAGFSRQNLCDGRGKSHLC